MANFPRVSTSTVSTQTTVTGPQRPPQTPPTPPTLTPTTPSTATTRTTPSPSLQAHKQQISSQQELVSPSTVQKVSETEASVPKTFLAENASLHSEALLKPLMQSIVPSAPPLSSPASPKAPAPKTAPGLSTPQRIDQKKQQVTQLESQLTRATAALSPKHRQALAALPGRQQELVALEGNLANPKVTKMLGPDGVKKLTAQIQAMQKEFQSLPPGIQTCVKLQREVNTLKADIQAMSQVQRGPTSSEMLKDKGKVLHKLYDQATPELPTEITQLNKQLGALRQDIGRLAASLPPDAETRTPDLVAVRTAVDGKAQPVRDQIAKVQSEAAKIADPTARKAFVEAKLTPLQNQLETIMKPLHEANGIVSLKAKLDEAMSLEKKIAGKQTLLDTSVKARGLEDRRQDLMAQIAAHNSTPESLEALKTELKGVTKELHELEEKIGHGGMDWGRVKKEYLGSDRREVFMKAVIDFRQQFVLTTFKEVVADLKKAEVGKLKGELAELEKAPKRDLKACSEKMREIMTAEASWDKIDKRAVGSTDLTSDFDMTVLADRAGMDTAVMKEVNARFQQHFGKEAGNVFDTNLYVAGGGPAIKKEVKSGPKEWASPAAQASHDEGQDIASLVKQRLYSSPETWAAFTDKVKTGLETNLRAITPALAESDIKARVDAQISRFSAADALYTERDGKINAAIEDLKKLPENRSKSHYDLEISAMNRLFEAESTTADKIKAEWEALPSGTPSEKGLKDQKWAEYTRADAKAQLYANEPYFSEGPVRHVVGNEQALKGLDLVGSGDAARYVFAPKTESGVKQALRLDPVQALESLTENFGDANKELNHLKHEGKGMGDIAIKASKYMGRLTRAIDAAIPKDQQSETLRGKIDKLQQAEVELLRIRKGGQPPADFQGTTEEYGLAVLRKCGLGDLTTDTGSVKAVDKLQNYFESVTLEASIQIRTQLASPSA